MSSPSDDGPSDLELDLSDDHSISARLRYLLKTVFHLFYLASPDLETETHTQSIRIAQSVYSAVLLAKALQLLSLLYPTEPISSDWSRFSLWTTIVSIARVDFLLVRVGLGSFMYYAAAALVISPFFLYVLVYKTLKSQAERKWRLRVFIFKVLMRIVSGVLFMPFLCIFVASQRYLDSGRMFEYEGAEASSLAYPSVRVASVLWAVLLVGESAFAVLFMYDIFLVNSSQRIESRAHSKVELLSELSQVLCVISHFYVHERSPLVHFALCGVLSMLPTLCYVYFLPFYSLFANFMNALTYSVFTWGCFAMILSIFLEDSTSGFVLTLLVPLTLPPLLWDLIQRRKTYIQENYVRDFVHLRTPYQCELTLRFTTLDFKTKTSSSQSAWKDFYISTQSELFNRMTKMFGESMYTGLWEFAFIFSILRDESLARIKLSKTRNCSFDLECAFNQYRFMRILARHTEKVNEEVDYVNFRMLYDKAKKADEDSCMFQLDFWTELSSDNPIVKKVETLARKVNVSIARAKELLSRLVQQYPKSHLALRLYGSFLTEVINDTEKGNDLTSRSLFEEHELNGKALTMENHFSYFDDSNGIILISGSQESIGTIVYLNTEAASILGANSKIALGMNIASFLPSTIVSQQVHDIAMQRFLLYSKSNDVGLPFNLFLIDMTGFLIEIRIQVKCMSLDLRQFFIVAVRRNYAPREVCIFDTDLLVKSHTRSFPSVTGYSDQNILFTNMHIYLMIQNFAYLHETYAHDAVFMYTIPGTVNKLAMRFFDLSFRGRLFHLLYCTQDEEETKRWRNAAQNDVPENFSDLKQEEIPVQLSVVIESEPLARSSSLKSSLKRPGAPKKKLNVMFDLVPQFFELPETDFRPGKGIIGKVKDAAPVDSKAKTISFKGQEGEKGDGKEEENNLTGGEICDLKDLENFTLQGPRDEMPEDQQSKVSIAILSELAQGIDRDNKQSGKSVASSAVSSNSSFTSSATAIQLLKVVQTSMTRFKCAFLFTNLVVVCSVIAMMVYLTVASQHFEEILIIQELSSQRCLCAVMAALARNLMLIYGQLLPIEESASYRSQLQVCLQEFDTTLDLLMNKVDEFSSAAYRSLFLDSVVPTWEYSAGVIVFTQDNLLNILKRFSSYTTSVLVSAPDEMNYTHPGLYYLYRNGQGETMKVMNESAWEFIAGEQEAFKVTLNVIGGLGILALILMLACFLVVMLPTVIQVDRSNQDVWTFFYKLPLDVIQDLKFRREERIESTHGIEMEQKQGELTHFKSIKKRILIKCSRKWPYVFSRIWVYYLITVAYAVYFYFDVYGSLGRVLIRKPEVLNLIGERDLEVQSAYHWLQETLIENTSLSFFVIDSPSQPTPSPRFRLQSILSRLHLLEDSLVAHDSKTIGLNANSSSVTFDSACADGDSLCEETLIARGVHSALVGFTLDVEFLSYTQTSLSSPELLSLRRSTSLLHSQLTSLLQTTQSQLSDDISAVRLRMELLTAAYCVLVIVFYVLVYLPMASLVRKQLTDIWDLAGLIPLDLLEKIKRAMRVTDASGEKKK